MKAGMMAGAIVIALLQSGCVIHRQTQPEVEGRLIDSGGRPVTHARLTLVGTADKPDETLSDNDGRFAFQPQHEWIFFLPIGPMDWFYHSLLRANANGNVYEGNLGGGPGGPFALEDKVIKVVCTVPDEPGEMICRYGL